MGITRENGGYSAHVEGFLVLDGRRIRVAKTNGETITLAEACELPPGTEGDLLIIIDGDADSKRIELPDGVALGQRAVRYQHAVPF